MLMRTEGTAEQLPMARANESEAMNELARHDNTSAELPTRLTRVLSVEWLGQTIASVCWIVSVLSYGISSSGDWLQLIAASAWLVANVATVVTGKAA